MNIVILWLCLVTVSQPVHSVVITVSNDGSHYPSCCSYGHCLCNSFSNALSSIRSNTVINITSPSVSLDTSAYIQNANNIKIMSNDGATVLCNDVGVVLFKACSDVTFEAIIWDQCGNLNNLNNAGITFDEAISNVSIINCTFQQFKVCTSVSISKIDSEGSISVINSKFKSNAVSNASLHIYSTLLVLSSGGIDITIIHCFTTMEILQGSGLLNGSLAVSFGQNLMTQSILVKNSSFVSNGIRAVYIEDSAVQSNITFDDVNISDNRFGIYALVATQFNVISSHFAQNSNGALEMQLGDNVKIELFNTTFANNNATANTLGTALYITSANDSTVNISLFNFYNNVGGNNIVHIAMNLPFKFPLAFINVLINSSDFVNNKNGSALKVAKSFLKFYSTTLFQDNSARSGAAVYIAESSQIIVGDGSTVQFINNTASLHGGAMYIDLSNCYNCGVIFANLSRYDSFIFINNSAKLSGNSMYFNIPDSSDVVRDYNKIVSAAYVPYRLNYTQSQNISVPEIAASPYEIKLCSFAMKDGLKNSANDSACVIMNNAMLGEPIYFNTILRDYFNNAAEATKFQVICIDCDFKYRPLV